MHLRLLPFDSSYITMHKILSNEHVPTRKGIVIYIIVTSAVLVAYLYHNHQERDHVSLPMFAKCDAGQDCNMEFDRAV